MKADLKENPKFFEEATHYWTENSKWIINSSHSEVKNAYFYIQEIGHFDTFFQYSTVRSNLKSFFLAYTISGEGVLQYDGKAYSCEKGSAFLIDCKKDHKYFTPNGKSWELFWIHFDGLQAEGCYLEYFKNQNALVYLKEKSIIEDNFKRLLNLFEQKTSSSEIIGSNLIHSILVELILQNNNLVKSTAVIPDFVLQIMEHLRNNYSAPISLDQLSEITFRSKFYLATQFKKYVGTSINQYLLKLRFQKSKELLQSTRKSVAEITYLVGFNSSSHFIKLFKQNEWMTPQEFRRQWSAGDNLAP